MICCQKVLKLSPIGVYNLRVADPISRDIFFVAACRTFGIPARLNPETQIPEYSKNGEWLRAGFDHAAIVQPEKGSLKLITLSSLIAGKHSVLVLSVPDKEPSKHILNDPGPYVDHFDKSGAHFYSVIVIICLFLYISLLYEKRSLKYRRY